MKTTKYKCAACGKNFERSITLKSDVGVFEGCPHCGCWDFDEKRKNVITKTELKQYVSLVRETERMSERLSELKFLGKDDSELYEMYENNKLRCLALTLKIQSFIFDIDDSLLRQVFDAKYISGLSWAGVSARLGGYYSEDNLRIMHDRYLKSLEKTE